MFQLPAQRSGVGIWGGQQAQETNHDSTTLVAPLSKLLIAPHEHRSETLASSEPASHVPSQEHPGLSVSLFTHSPEEIVLALEARRDSIVRDAELRHYLTDHNIDAATLDHHLDHMREQVLQNKFSRAEQLGLQSDLAVYLHGSPVEVFRRVTHHCKKVSQLLNCEYAIEDLLYRTCVRSGLNEEAARKQAEDLLARQSFTALYDTFRANLPRLADSEDYDLRSFVTLSGAKPQQLDAADRKMVDAAALLCVAPKLRANQSSWSYRTVAYLVAGQPLDVFKYCQFYTNAPKNKVMAGVCDLHPENIQKKAINDKSQLKEPRKSRKTNIPKHEIEPLKKHLGTISLAGRTTRHPVSDHKLYKAAMWLINTGHMYVEDLPESAIARLINEYNRQQADGHSFKKGTKLEEGLQVLMNKREAKKEARMEKQVKSEPADAFDWIKVEPIEIFNFNTAPEPQPIKSEPVDAFNLSRFLEMQPIKAEPVDTLDFNRPLELRPAKTEPTSTSDSNAPLPSQPIKEEPGAVSDMEL